MLYLAYGSNLHPARIRSRIPNAEPVGTCSVAGRRLAFHLASSDGSGKCDIPVVDGPKSRVFGALYRLDAAGWSRLDEIEGLGCSYRRQRLPIGDCGLAGEAVAYVALTDRIDPSLRPYSWYRELVLEGARYHGFPSGYLEMLSAVPVIADPDSARARSNLSVLQPYPASKPLS